MLPLRISILQTDIQWEDKKTNLRRLREKLQALRGETEIVVLPETFSTGFSMNVEEMAETTEGPTIRLLRQWAAETGIALTGSFIACDEGKEGKVFCNRAFFLTPEGETFYSDKRHLFRMGNEGEHFQAGNRRTIVHYRGWNLLLLVCYDLRFPVWSRNRKNEYDVLLYVANWPASRRQVWDVLLQARALENMSYVCGVNRIGTDGNGLWHNGGSAIYSYRGERLADIPDGEEGVATTTLDSNALRKFRERFPAWKDADTFILTQE